MIDYINSYVGMLPTTRERDRGRRERKGGRRVGSKETVREGESHIRLEHMLTVFHMHNVVDVLTGRVDGKRESGVRLIFYDLRGESTKMQVMANAR